MTLRRVVRVLSFVFAGLGVSYVMQGVVPDPGAEFPFVANSFAKDGTFAVLCFVAAADVRRHMWAVWVVIGAHALIITGLLTCLAFGQISDVSGSFVSPPGTTLPGAEVLFFMWLGLATAVTALLWWLARRAARARFQLSFLAPHQHRTLMALAEVLVMGDEEAITEAEIAANVDDYLFHFPAREKNIVKLALTGLTIYPLIRLRPPFPLLSPPGRLEFIERRFIADVAERRLPGFLRRPLQSMLFAAQQLTFIGYYGDPRTASATGYVPFSERQRGGTPAQLARRPHGRIEVSSPAQIDAEQINADVAVVGSGAAGALLAHRLAQRGREVLLLERGRHVDPGEFSEDERKQFAALYADGGMQRSTDSRFQVLQGRCVGGTTVVNNAVCFDLPAEVLTRWNDGDGLDAGLDEAGIRAAFSSVRGWLPVSRQSQNGMPGRNAQAFAAGIDALGLRESGEFEVVDANIADCLGCGYCNIGCPFGRKLSALDVTLPRAQAEFGDSVRIVSECRVDRVRERDGRATLLECELSDGRSVQVSANVVVLAAGAIASSVILQRSRLGGPNVGQGLAFNVGAPVTADFEERMDSFDGLQISHYLRPPGDDGTVLETWFNPVGAQSLVMPGWFSDHFRNMRRYSHMGCAGAVIGTRPDATVGLSWPGRNTKLRWSPHPGDLERLVKAIKLAGRIFLAAGATRVMPNTFRYLEFTRPEQLDTLDTVVRDNTDINLNSAHPQGGNAISRDPAKGVVDERFRVHGAEGLYVCDASVFPSSITVNPQLTVMALAEYGSALID